MKPIINDFLHFYQFKKAGTKNSNNIYLWLMSGYVLLTAFKILFFILKTILTKSNLITPTTGAGSPEQWIAETSLYVYALQVAILAPLYEEFAFRGTLQKNKPIFIFSVVVFLFLATCLITKTPIYEISLISSLLFISILMIVLFFKTQIIVIVQAFAIRNTKSLVYINSLLFALWHYGNFDFSKANFLSIVFAFLPHFMSGLIFSWISIRKGFFAGLLLHFINNALPVLVALIKNS